jgi:hypothetical protein
MLLARALLRVEARRRLPSRLLSSASRVLRPFMSGLHSVTVRRLVAATSICASSRIVSRAAAASVADFASVLHARVASLLVLHHMTVLLVYDSHLLQVTNELEEVLLEFRLVHL